MTKRVLFVDDTKSFADSASRMLRQSGYDVVTAYSPESAVAAIDSQLFDLVITDKQMLGDDEAGFTVVKAARAKGNMPVIMMSGEVLEEEEVQVLQERLRAMGENIQFMAKTDLDWFSKVLAILGGRQIASDGSRQAR